MGGLTQPSTSLVSLPAPGSQFPGLAQGLQQGIGGGMFGGAPGNVPGLGPTSLQSLTSLSKTGNPTDVGAAFEAIKASMQHGIAEGRSNLLEGFGQMGLRNSSSAIQGASDFETNTQAQFANILAQYTMQAQEAAAGRQLQASGIGAELFQGLGTATYPTAALSTGASPLQTIGGVAQGGAESLIMMAALGLI